MKCSIQQNSNRNINTWVIKLKSVVFFLGSPMLTNLIKVEINEACWSDESHWECVILGGTQTESERGKGKNKILERTWGFKSMRQKVKPFLSICIIIFI